MANTFNLRKQIDVKSICANIDSLYGPYDNINDALSALKGREAIGRTVGVIQDGEIVEYWFKSGTSKGDFTKKLDDASLVISIEGDSNITVGEDEPIYVKFSINGRIAANKAILYKVVNGNEIQIKEFTSIGKNSINTITIDNPDVSGVYTYRIKVLDTAGAYALTLNEENYVEYTIRYGEISTIYNFTVLNTITIKNYSTVANKYFMLNISVRDDSFMINDVYLSDINDTNTEGLKISLVPYKDQLNQNTTYIANNYYFLPDSSTLKQFNGKQCSIVVDYSENGQNKTKVEDIFKLLNISTIELISDSDNNTYYATLPSYYTFTLQSGVENLSIVLSPGDDSDFMFDITTVISYKKFSLKIIPNNDPKSGAQISIRYSFRYNNAEYTGIFKSTIGNILELPEQKFYEPESGATITLEKIIDANSEDYSAIEDGKYYKIISNEISTEQYASSFILDMYCKIHQENDTSLKYVDIKYGDVERIYINEDEISGSNLSQNLVTDTPLNEWVQITIGVNLNEDITRNGEKLNAWYHAIYINGMVVKNVKIDESNVKPLTYISGNTLSIKIGNGILVQRAYLYYNNQGTNTIYPNTDQGKSISYNNYFSHNTDFEEPTNDLPVLRLMKITDEEENTKYFNLINAYKKAHDEDELKHTTIFGNIGLTKATTINEYDKYYSSSTIETDASLFRQSVDIKKPAQKEYTVLCYAQYIVNGVNLLEGVIVEVHTQGTSTLVYSVPNFKFTFWIINENGELEHYYPSFIIKNDDSDNYYKEYIYTAKADYMDSSHLNNTPTCNYFNNLVQTLISDKVITGSPSARNGGLDAIMGFPIIMEISDNADNFDDTFINIGSFMLNIDKTGDSLGFEIIDGEDELTCISFEGTSNDNTTGASGRFDIPSGYSLVKYTDDSYDINDSYQLKDYTDNEGNVNEDEIKSDYEEVINNIKGKYKPTDYYNGILVSNYPYIKWCKMFSDGLEYRYPDSDIYKEKNDIISKVMDMTHFINLYKVWIWVCKSDELSTANYREQFVKYFDLEYCILYFIQLMTYAQTDNLGKNAMFDCWAKIIRDENGEITSYDYSNSLWYPRPYDLDSEAGLDNNGNDNIATFVEIRPTFSLNYDESRATDWEWRIENYLIDDNDVADNPSLGLTASTIKYGSQTYDRYHFSSNKSKLWINFYKNFKNEIESFYYNLRNTYNYGPDSIISLCKEKLIDVLGINQYNQDFINKYLANSDQSLAYGNRWYKFKKWITKRFAFCDSYFSAFQSAIYSTTSQFNYTVKVDAPQYVAQNYQSNKNIKFVLDSTSFSAGSGAATKITLLVNQGSVFETSLFKYVTRDSGSAAYTNLLSLDVSNNKNSGFNNITSVTGESLDNLKYLNISNSNIQQVNVPINVKTLIAENVTLNELTFEENCAIESISLKNSTINSSVYFNSLPNLTKLDLTNCTFKLDVTFNNLPQLSNLIMDQSIFSGIVYIGSVNVDKFDFSNLSLGGISFSGNNLNIDTINFHNTTFTNDTLNVNAIASNIKNLYFNGVSGLKYIELNDDTVKFDNLECFSFAGSSIIALGKTYDNESKTGTFDCSWFNDMANLKKVNSFKDDGTITYTSFNFQNTEIQEIDNLNWSGPGTNLFRECRNLSSINGTLNLISNTTDANGDLVNSNINYMFYKCYALTSLPTITIDNSITSATYLFAGVKRLSYSNISSVIKKCIAVTDFSHMCRCTVFDQSQTIDLDSLFANNNVVASLYYAFSTYTSSDLVDDNHTNYIKASNNLVITGHLPSTTQSAGRMFWCCSKLKIPYDIFNKCTSLTNVKDMFASTSITFTESNDVDLPIYTYTIENDNDESETINVYTTNLIESSFLPTSLINISGMFYNSNICTHDSKLFINLTDLTTTNSMFGASSPKKFTFTGTDIDTGSTKSGDISINIVQMWANNPKITDISGCFSNIYNIECTGLQFDSSITNSTSINISGLLGLSNSTYRSNNLITINLDSIVPKLITNGTYSIPGNESYDGVGVFQNRKVLLNSNSTNVLSKLTSACRKMFQYAIIYVSDTVEEFDLSNVTTSCENMFYGARLYAYNNTKEENGENYEFTDRYFIKVIMPEICGTYTNMFRNSSILYTWPKLSDGITYLSSSASNLSNMYYGCAFKENDIELPANYFANCKNSLTNTSYMFAYNMFLTTLGYDKTVGLFEGCTSLSNATYMFYNCNFLHKGIPSNFFGTTPLTKLTSLAYMFALTSILYDVDDVNKCISSTTIDPLTKLSSIEGMFYRIKINQYVNAYSSTSWNKFVNSITDNDNIEHYTIDATTFSNISISNIKKLFENTSGINIPFQFYNGFEYGNDAFLNSGLESINSEFVATLNISSIKNVSRMFYQNNYGGRYKKTIENLGTFINNIINYANISKQYVAGNLTNEDIDSTYTVTSTDANSIITNGFDLYEISNETAENWNTDYYRRVQFK